VLQQIGERPIFILLILCVLIGCRVDNISLDPADPIPGNSGTITTTGVTAATLTLNWTAATDNTSPQANLQYLAYYSTANNINTVANCEANGTAIGSYAPNIVSKNVTGLTPTTSYYFNVIVQDEAGNRALYSTLSEATL
jgi:hypothetical protein